MASLTPLSGFEVGRWDPPLLLHCPWRGAVDWRQMPYEQARLQVEAANAERTIRRKLVVPSPVSEAEVAFLAGLMFYNERPLLQHPCGPYDLDFYIDDYDAAIEVDGAQHDPSKDARRDLYVLRRGIHTYRMEARRALLDPLWAARTVAYIIVQDARKRRRGTS